MSDGFSTREAFGLSAMALRVKAGDLLQWADGRVKMEREAALELLIQVGGLVDELADTFDHVVPRSKPANTSFGDGRKAALPFRSEGSGELYDPEEEDGKPRSKRAPSTLCSICKTNPRTSNGYCSECRARLYRESFKKV